MDVWFTIRTLKSKGVSIKKIARELGVSRNTVRKYLRNDKPPQYTSVLRVNKEIVPFEEEIKIMLTQEFIGSRILEELRKKGYQGPGATFYRQLKHIKADTVPSKAVERFETPPGKQGQYDWSDYTVPIGGVLTKVHISSIILGFSRYRHYFASLDIKQGTIFEALEHGFRHFEGVPKEILFDNPKAIVTTSKPHLKWNPRFLEFAGYYRFEPIACWPGRARTKGKVENPFYYLEQHFIKGSAFKDFGDFIVQLARFEKEIVNVRVHGTTQARPLDRFAHEKLLLTSLPPARFVSIRETFRKVSWDCLISFDGCRYSVPWRYVGKSVWVRTSRGCELEVYSQRGELIAWHHLSKKKGLITMKKEHYAGLRQGPPNTRALVVKVFQELFPEQTLFLEKLLAQNKFNATVHLREILELVRSYPKPELRHAFELALEYNTFTHNFVRGVLSQQGNFCLASIPSVLEVSVPQVNVRRGLEDYQTLISGGE
jgi:transposase